MAGVKPIRVTCGIILKDDKVLIVQRSSKMSLPLKWEFPGGKVNEQESEEECLMRELKEELNISVRIVRRLSPNVHNYGSFVIELVPFVVVYTDGEIVLSEHCAKAYVAKNELGDFDFAPADLPILGEYLSAAEDVGE